MQKEQVESTAFSDRSFDTEVRGVVGFAKSIVDPTIVATTLWTITHLYGHAVTGAYVLLGMLAFLLSYPGTIPFRHSKADLLREISANWVVLAAVMFGFGYLSGYVAVFDPDVLTAWFVSTPIVLWLVHVASPLYVPRIIALQGHQTAIIVGANGLGNRIAETINSNPFEVRKVVGFFDDRGEERLKIPSSLPLAGNLKAVASYVKAAKVNIIFVTLPVNSQPRMMALFEDLRDTTASIYYAPDIFMHDLIQARMDKVGNVPVLAVCETPFQGTDGLLKRATDILISATVLVLTSPMLLAIAIAIKATSAGPVIFKQRRYGLDGREIIVWKFRSMSVTEDGDKVYRQVTKQDARVTPLGRFLRKTSLDEMPQFVNVLQGTMSVVGPRPHAVSVNEQYRKQIPGYMVRHKVKPGITGLAQINGYRGGDDLESMTGRVHYDTEYLRTWSLALDLKILAKTALMMVRGDPKAY